VDVRRVREDPFIESIDGREHVIAVHRSAGEEARVFAASWHSDWSFQPIPPAATCRSGIVIPPVGGDTLFADQHRAAETLPTALRQRVEGRAAVHSAVVGAAARALPWQTQEAFQYRHHWEPNTLVMWDNRSVLHMATAGYDGHERVLHRTTVAGTATPVAA
jgi:alpha-ketoglutarate-dependent taurine dioxygenase